MDNTRIAVSLPSETAYVYGTVNGQQTVWTAMGGGTWETIAPRSKDDTYNVHLQVYKENGNYYETEFVLYWGVVGLIFDRTQVDVDRVVYLAGLGWENMTPQEQAEWMTALKGAYNTSDLNRVGHAVDYIANRFLEFGYEVSVAPKTDWSVVDIPTPEQMEDYLRDVETLRGVLAVLPTTPPVPDDMDKLTYIEANNIERILWDVNALVNNMIRSWYYCGEVYCGEV